MQNIYLLDSDTSEFQSLAPPDDDTFIDLVGQFDGTPIGAAWSPFAVEYDRDSENLARGDFPSLTLSHIPVFSRRAVEVLRPLLNACGELLPVKCEDGEYFAFNVTVLLDALDVNTSDIVRFSSGRVMDVKTYVLDSKHLGSASIFKVPETALMDVFVTGEFLELVEKAQLSGFSFTPVRVL